MWSGASRQRRALQASCVGPEPVVGRVRWPTRADQGRLSAGVQNRTALADVAVKCSEKTARGPSIAAEILALRIADREITAKTWADLGCCPRAVKESGLTHTETLTRADRK